MYIYDVFQVVNSTAPIFGGKSKSKLVRVGTVRADNSNFAVIKLAHMLDLDNDLELYAHLICRY
jgi:hypothetical protein